jgi:hypothetical protein
MLVATLLLCLPAPRAAAEPLTPPRAWALAAAAMLAESNGDRHDRLAGVDVTPANVEAAKRLLRDWWGVTDRTTHLDALRGVAERGHRAQFAAAGAGMATMAPAERTQLEARRRQDFRLNQIVGVVELHYARLGATGILGWDFSRFIALCRWGYTAGYLTEPEAWDTLMPAARRLRGAFTSWRELGENYLIGRQFWDPEQHVLNGKTYRRTLDRLLTDPESPWTRIPWELDLESRRR